MRQLLTELPKGVYWEGTAAYYFVDQYPNGVPEDYFSIIGEGAQADFQAIRLDGMTLAIRMGSVANQDSPGSPPPPSRLDILRRTDDGWSNITIRVLPPWALKVTASRLNKNGTITVWSTKGVRTIRFDGIRFIEVAEQIAVADRHQHLCLTLTTL